MLLDATTTLRKEAQDDIGASTRRKLVEHWQQQRAGEVRPCGQVCECQGVLG